MAGLEDIIDELFQVKYVLKDHDLLLKWLSTISYLPRLLTIREHDGVKGVKLLLKICSNIINNPTQTQKYGHLNLQKIGQKLSKCEPALKLLMFVGFEISENKTRLIWINTENNAMLLTHVKQTLSSIIETTPIQSSNKTTIKHSNNNIIDFQNTSLNLAKSSLKSTQLNVCYIVQYHEYSHN